jgi:hypothetical protein
MGFPDVSRFPQGLEMQISGAEYVLDAPLSKALTRAILPATA